MTAEQTRRRTATPRRHRGAALLCACLFAAPALPVFAMQPPASATANAPATALPAAATPAIASVAAASATAAVAVPAVPMAAQAPTAGKSSTAPARSMQDAVVVLDQPMSMSDRALLLASDINRLTGKPSAAAGDEAATSTGSRIQSVLQRALTLLGTPYRWGGTTTDGFDCSGLVGYVFRTTLGIELPRVSRDMARSGKEVDRASLVPGDLVFFGRKGRVDHVGIYLGEGRFVHAPRTGRDVTVSKLDGYWGRKFLEARRVAGI